MLWIITGIISSYIIGSFPTAYLFVMAVKGADIRTLGSGNVGATNTFRVLGKIPASLVLLVDIIKGFIAAGVISKIIYAKFSGVSLAELGIIFGALSIGGHNWSVFLKFRGGKGVATTLGVLIGLSAIERSLASALGLASCIWILVFLLTRIISVASVLTAFVLPIFAVIFKTSPALITFCFIVSSLVILRHKSNIKRFLSGQEKKLF